MPGYRPTLDWDIWRYPSSALRKNNRGNIYRITDADLGAPGTAPAADSVTIACRAGVIGDFWPNIEVHGSPVTVEKILDAIHEHFHKEINQTEYAEIREMDSRNHSLIVQAMQDRCQRANELFENAWRVGLRRLDCLGDTHFFKGLQVEYSSDDTWKLNLDLGPSM